MRSQQQVQIALDEWLETRGLTFGERVMIRTLRQGLVALGVEEFTRVAAHLFVAMPDVVKSAITKARAQGVCQEWPNA